MNADKIKHFKSSINSTQRIIVAVSVPILTLLISYGVIDAIAKEAIWVYRANYNLNPLSLRYTWWMWAPILVGLAIFEFLWLGTPKQ